MTVGGMHDREMPPIEGCYLGDAQPLGGDHHRRVHGSQSEVPMAGDELCDAQPVGGATGSTVRSPAATSPTKRTSASAPSLLAIRYTNSVTTRVGMISGPG